MLQSMRENMKGPTAKIVVGVAVAAMVLFGVESLFVNSVGGSEVATVNGEDVSEIELLRAIEQQKNRLRQQFDLDETSDMLNDDRLRTPALMNLVRQKALHHAASEQGMNVSPSIVKAELAKAFTRDGEFNKAQLNNYIAAYGYTPATLAQSEANAYVLRQLFNGVSQTEFVTQAEMDAMAAIAGQKRSFATIEISRSLVEDKVTVTDEEIAQYYQANEAQFTEPEKVALEYVEVTIADLAKTQNVSDKELKAEYDREQQEFQGGTEYRVSHILIESADDSAAKIAEISAKLKEGQAFADLAKEYSDDLGSKALGGELGLMVEGAFPAEFEEAAKALSAGNVSAPVVTDAGTHFIRLDEKVVVEPESFESRKEALAAMLREQKASVAYLEKIQVLEEVSFGASDLSATASALGVPVKSTDLFARGRGTGIAANTVIANAAFAEDVYAQGQNSQVLEVEGSRAFVVRLKQKVPATVQPLEDVKESITQQITQTKVINELQTLAADVVIAIEKGEKPEVVAEEGEYSFNNYEGVERSNTDVDFMVSREAFSLPRPDAKSPAVTTVNGAEGLTVVVLSEVVDGDVDNLPKEQRDAMEQQLRNQLASGAVESFENRVFEGAKYKLK
ncbi:SurA N-terminal domain-containing protein [Marinagarivorans algicola]|uniref:SurA N-terminal domain-containing protein n=1 Tax=Marinagarivorans algicola TaxID=1513270 RepID=UPI0006B668FD|nr:SurA N-terminal domain-containing protein [Marinagarivorans algicola]